MKKHFESKVQGGVGILTTPSFDCPLFHPDVMILSKIWMLVDKPFQT